VRLDAARLCAGYGSVQVLHEVSLTIPEGSLVAILGPNGAGKSTLLKTLAGLLPVMDGDVRLDDESYRGRDARTLARTGVTLVPQTGAVFPNLTVLENLHIGALGRAGADPEIADTLAEFPMLAERPNQLAGSLSGGERQVLAITAALLMRPKVLLLDEPTTGLAPLVATQIADLILAAVGKRMAVGWVVEQMPELALKRAEHAYFLEGGEITFEGPASVLLERERLEELMLQQA
jgi:branched-chain amino acid transport system ATP-binding protein